MSGLEDAAAAHARQQRQAADAGAVHRAEAQKARQQAAALLRERAREFFDFARDHGAPLFPLYLQGSMEHDGWYARIEEPCVTAEDFVVVNMRSHHTVRNLTHDTVSPHFVAAAAALLDPVPVRPSHSGNLTGVQGDGLIGYQL